jgi:hypothetical protein
VAEDAGEAYELLRQSLVDADLDFDSDRELQTVELLADESEYPDCGHRLLVIPAPAELERGEG